MATRALALVLGSLALWGPWVHPASAGAVVLVQSSPIGPYRQAADAFQAAYHGPVSAFTLEGCDPAQLAARLESAHPEVVVAIGLKAALFARDRLPRTPVVFCVVPNPERFDLLGDWATGVSADVPPERDLAALRLAAPDVRRVGLLYGRSTGGTLAQRARSAAAAAHLTLVEAPVEGPADLLSRARDLAGRVDALWLPADPAVATPEAFALLLKLSLERGLPLLAFSESLVRSGALVAVAPDYTWIGERTAEIVRRVQNGERAGDIGVLPLTRTQTVLNAATARALGRAVPAGGAGGLEVLP